MGQWKNHKFPIVIILVILGIVLFYQFSFLFPFTDNAFIVANVRPVAANVNGYVTDIYIKNEQTVKKGQPLFTVFRKPYQLAYIKAKNDVAAAQAHLTTLKKQAEKNHFLITSQQERYEKYRFDYEHNKAAYRDRAVSKIRVNNLLRNKNAAFNQLKALEKELEAIKQQIIEQQLVIGALMAVMKNAKVDLDETTVYARNNGVIQNMFVALGAPIKIHKPIFSFVDTDTLFVQANFNETDLRTVRPGNKVSIFPRIYLGTKVYHGVVYSQHWAASRMIEHNSTQLEIVSDTVTNWFLLPQRLPVQIAISDYDPEHYPLSVGTSVYVYIHT